MKVRWIGALALFAATLGFAEDESPKELAAPSLRSSVRVAIVGGAVDADMAKLVGELNEVSPDLVMTTGNLASGDTKDVREELSKLKMTWYPCVGTREAAGDAKEYAKQFGPRYFSVDAGDVHLISLDSEETSGAAIFSDAQLIWLAKDLDRAFRRARQVAVVMHRPAWRDEKSNWEKVHRMLVAFGQRPVVAIEGQPNSNVRGGKVGAVFAAGNEYCEDDTRDGVRYFAVGPVKGTGNAATGRMGQYVIARIGDDAAQVSVVETGRVHAANLVTRAVREAMEKIEKPGVIGVEGSIEYAVGKDSGTPRAGEGTVWLVLENPLDVLMTVRTRLEGDANWKMSGAESGLAIKPREKLRVRIGIFAEACTKELAAPEIVFAVAFDKNGRELELRRPVRVEKAKVETPK